MKNKVTSLSIRIDNLQFISGGELEVIGSDAKITVLLTEESAKLLDSKIIEMNAKNNNWVHAAIEITGKKTPTKEFISWQLAEVRKFINMVGEHPVMLASLQHKEKELIDELNA